VSPLPPGFPAFPENDFETDPPFLLTIFYAAIIIAVMWLVMWAAFAHL